MIHIGVLGPDGKPTGATFCGACPDKAGSGQRVECQACFDAMHSHAPKAPKENR